ncbi:MAG TPA: ATP-binding protein, partial [Stellaceae bacterium]|nr:ATP-binding protein [Stellaceae bacterium]
NRATERAYGRGYDEVVGRTVEDILGTEQAATPLRLMRACIKTGRNQRYTARRTLAGVTRTIDVMFVHVPEQQDGDHFIMATARDITERDAIEEQLRQAQKMEAVGQLTGGLAHDFNNLLTAVLGNLELLAPRLGEDASARKYLAAAARSAENGAKLTEQLLAFSRRQQLQPRATDLNAVIAAMRELLTRTIGATVRVETALAPDLWPALVDPTQIEVAILNLVLNARDAMPRGGTVTIATRNLLHGDPAAPPELAGREGICITVRDNGVGMSEEVARAAVEPFFTTKEPGKGSGLGLSQVYGVVRQSSGALSIESRPGAGTAVHICLPRATAAARDAVHPAPPQPSEAASGRILVVDDNPDVRQVTCEMLRGIGYRVTGVESGAAALLLIDAGEAYDLLLVDIAMPGLNGVATVERARRLSPGLRVLYATGYADVAEDAEPRIKKPFRLDELAARVREAIAGG